MRPLRIALLCYRGNMHCGGQGIYLWHMARELARAGHRVDVFSGPPAPDPMPFCRDVVPIWSDEFWAKWFVRDYQRFFPAASPAAILSPLRLCELGASRIGYFTEPLVFSLRAFREITRRGAPYDVVHDVQSLGYGLLALRAIGLPVLSTVHHPLSVDRRAALRRDVGLRERIGTLQFHPVAMQRRVARRLDAVITASRVGQSLLERDFAVATHRIFAVGNGIDTDHYQPDSRVARDPHRLLCVARAGDPNKGVGTAIEALRHLPDPVHLTLVDEDYAGQPARALAQRHGVAKRVTITGRLPADTLLRHYREAALVLVPSRFEGFGLPAVEALACGTAVVATRAGALPEILGPVAEILGSLGRELLVPRDDAAALASRAADLLANPAECAHVGQVGREWVLAHAAWPAVAARTIEVYREAIDARGRPATSRTSDQDGARCAARSSRKSKARAA